MRQQAEQKISPLGFVNGDFIYGKMKSEDAGKKASGESITPMYELEIRNSKNKKVASYSFVDKGIYISDILIDDNMVTLNRVEKSGDIYNVTSQEFITNNEERKDTAIKNRSIYNSTDGKTDADYICRGSRREERESDPAESAGIKE